MKELTPSEVATMLSDPKVIIVDVREDFEVNLGTIPGAKHIPLDEITSRFKELNKSNKHVIICRSGSRSGVATHFLNEQGYDAYNMVGGMIDWHGDIE